MSARPSDPSAYALFPDDVAPGTEVYLFCRGRVQRGYVADTNERSVTIYQPEHQPHPILVGGPERFYRQDGLSESLWILPAIRPLEHDLGESQSYPLDVRVAPVSACHDSGELEGARALARRLVEALSPASGRVWHPHTTQALVHQLQASLRQTLSVIETAAPVPEDPH